MSVSIILEHLLMVVAAVFCSILVGLPLGIASYFFTRVRRIILFVADVLQTVPSLALLGIIMIFVGAGKTTVIIGITLYSLLPIVRNTYLGLSEVDPGVKEAARGMGMSRFYRLMHVELPLAFPIIFTGIRIATVNAIGTVVFAASVGGGGLGAIIYKGIRVMNMKWIAFGTLSLMAMAIVFDIAMGGIETRLNRKFSGPSN
ncbi:MAG: ABC transporter permease [Firmicutes bacterium HGW-Firmicutes-9]|jgi:osmoprotectant transport system permease protein|nr:MAG: ABC transporter permease [Firmicutes bacterium HGW-Firmicutes-9]